MQDFIRKVLFYSLLLACLLILTSCGSLTSQTDVSDVPSQPVSDNTDSVVHSDPVEESSELESPVPIESATPLTEEERLTEEKEFYRQMNSLRPENIAKLEITFFAGNGAQNLATSSNPKLIRQWLDYFQSLEVTAYACSIDLSDGGIYHYQYYDWEGECHIIFLNDGMLRLPDHPHIEWKITKSNGKWKELYDAMEIAPYPSEAERPSSFYPNSSIPEDTSSLLYPSPSEYYSELSSDVIR